jgi:hypothetical protein
VFFSINDLWDVGWFYNIKYAHHELLFGHGIRACLLKPLGIHVWIVGLLPV